MVKETVSLLDDTKKEIDCFPISHETRNKIMDKYFEIDMKTNPPTPKLNLPMIQTEMLKSGLKPEGISSEIIVEDGDRIYWKHYHKYVESFVNSQHQKN